MINDVSYNSGNKNIRKDYQIKRFINPLLNKKTSKFNTKLYLQIIAVVFIVYAIFYSDLFKVKAINVSGTKIIYPDEISQIAQQEL